MNKVIGIALLVPVVFAVVSLPFSPRVPTPNYPEQTQPSCGIAALSMLAAETANKEIKPDQWGLSTNSDELLVDDVLKAWKRTIGSELKASEKVWFDKPFLWVGTYEGTSHACLCYFTPTNVVLKHGVYDPSTKTNFIVIWDYVQFLTNTAAFFITR